MCAAKCRQEIVKRDLVRDIDSGEAETPFVFVTAKQVVIANRDIKQVARGDARWIVIIVRGPRRRYLQPCRSKIGRSARLNSAIWSSGLATAEETDCRLLGRRQCESIGEACDVTCNKSAIVTPGKCAPRAVPAPLVPRACRLLKLLIMVDSKRTPADGKEARPIVAHCRVPLEASDIGAAHTKRNAVQLRFLPGDWKRNRRIE